MSQVRTGWDVVETRATEPIEFEIGMRWRSLWRLGARPWVPLAFLQMLRVPADGALLGSGLRLTGAGPAVVQHWRDREAVQAWSRNPGEAHVEPWRRFAREAGGTADWGIWHRVGPATR